MKKKTLNRSIFAGALVIIAGLFAASSIKTGIYNSKHYEQQLTGSDLFTSAPGIIMCVANGKINMGD